MARRRNRLRARYLSTPNKYRAGSRFSTKTSLPSNRRASPSPREYPKTQRLLPAVPPNRIRKPEIKRIRTRSGSPRVRDPIPQNADPAKAQLAIADGLYIRKLYDLAVPEYEKYLGQFPTDPGRASAMYRLADCYANLGQEEPALNTYRMLVE